YDARRQQGDGGGVFGDSQFTSTLSVNFHFPKIPRRTIKKAAGLVKEIFSKTFTGSGEKELYELVRDELLACAYSGRK
ncbi:hypothetical protein, partial [Aeromonas caviae]|uniref:hypothetical protein n=1 Tax=Aeromonas caviae TaxID=648 RepID=UPI001CC33ADE